MNDETRLPEDLQHAVDLIMESDVLHEVAQESADAIRTEHAKRLTLQHHAADMARRVADLEAERDRLQHAYHQQRDDAQARVCAAIMRALAAEKERDELRARLAAVTNKAGEFVNDARGLVDESEGIAGLHLNGDVADWGSLLPGGRFERLTALDDLEELINAAPEHKA